MSVIGSGESPWYVPFPDVEGAVKDALGGYAAVGTFDDEDEDPWADWSGVETALDEKNTWDGYANATWLDMIPKMDQIPPAYSSGYASGGFIGSPAEWEPQPHQCPHCLRPRHPGPLTRTVATMLGAHQFDPNYDPDKDDSPIVCIGADYQGPPLPHGRSESFLGTVQGAPWLNYTIAGAGEPWTISDLQTLKIKIKLWTGMEQK